MKIKLLQLADSNEVLGQLNNTHGLSAVCAFSISKNIKKIVTELEVYNETRIKILEEKANKDEDGKAIIVDEQYQLTNENLVKANNEIQTLLNSDIDLDLTKISIEDLNNADLTPAQLSLIDYMIKE